MNDSLTEKKKGEEIHSYKPSFVFASPRVLDKCNACEVQLTLKETTTNKKKSTIEKCLDLYYSYVFQIKKESKHRYQHSQQRKTYNLTSISSVCPQH